MDKSRLSLPVGDLSTNNSNNGVKAASIGGSPNHIPNGASGASAMPSVNNTSNISTNNSSGISSSGSTDSSAASSTSSSHAVNGSIAGCGGTGHYHHHHLHHHQHNHATSSSSSSFQGKHKFHKKMLQNVTNIIV